MAFAVEFNGKECVTCVRDDSAMEGRDIKKYLLSLK